ncbi:DHHC palmitoyltransferase-domain-containing protein [Lactifluus subvellereus]|nr:DHHC palmitoyltransferase-domain-containing protein [Lactifluus subvellereus]
MATQRSLPFSPSTPAVPVSQRPSQLPSSLSTLNDPRGSGISSSATRHARTGSAVSSTSRPRTAPSSYGDPISPSHRSFAISSSISPSGTHAYGILPPPPFFHPSRPNYAPQPASDASRPSSASSFPLHDRDVVNTSGFSPQQLTHDAPYDSDGHSDSYAVSGSRTSRNSMQDALSQLPTRGGKHSREPLLPLAGLARSRSGSLNTHRSKPSLARNVVERNAANASAAARMRDSFERFRRGLSLESMRRSLSGSSASPSPVVGDLPLSESTNNEPTAFEVKENPDEEYKASRVIPLDLRRQSAALFTPYPLSKSAYPLSSVPIKLEKSARYVRNYERIPSSNRWFMRGRLLVGGDKPWAFIGSLALTFGIAGVWFGTTCVWWWHNKSPAVAAVGAYMCLLTISLMLSTAFKDPGILPRNLDPDPPYPSVAPDGDDNVPLPRDLKVRSAVVRVKYCTTCCTYRPPRSSHCRMCDNCVDGCDHHCQWVNNCVGRRNYTHFFALILTATLTLCLVIVTSALHLSMLTREKHAQLRDVLGKGVGSTVAFCLAITVIWPVSALLIYHVRLLYLNVTTIEQIRNSAHKSIAPGPTPPNPFAHSSWRGNLADALCRPGGFSWVQPHAVATEDKRLVNPGFEDQADFVVHDDAVEGRYTDTSGHA